MIYSVGHCKRETEALPSITWARACSLVFKRIHLPHKGLLLVVNCHQQTGQEPEKGLWPEQSMHAVLEGTQLWSWSQATCVPSPQPSPELVGMLCSHQHVKTMHPAKAPTGVFLMGLLSGDLHHSQ